MNDKTVVLNGAKINYDHNMDYSQIASDVTVYDDTPEDMILERIQGFSIVVTKEFPLSGELISQFPDSVRLICEAGTGYNNLDLNAARQKDITVCNIPAYSSQRVAQTAIMMILNLSSSMQKQLSMLARGDHSNFTDHLKVPHLEVNQKTLGLIGAGNIGREVIKTALAMNMKILVHTRTPHPDTEQVHYVSLEYLLSQSDYISLHCPLTPETHHIINKDTLSLIKPTAFLINTSRGALIDEPALIEALKEGKIAGAGLDVQETEPPVQASPLWTLDNVILTPHMGWRGLETRQRLVSMIGDDIRAFIQGKTINVVC